MKYNFLQRSIVYYFVFVLLLLDIIYCFPSNKPIVKTKWGLIRGLNQKFGGKEIRSFLGIPYALPPVGPLRFEKPIGLPRPYTGIYNANKFGPACLQTKLNGAIHSPNSTISENCLFLNVWTPRDASLKKMYPVFVYIHGSSFTFGSAAGPRSRGDVLTAYTDIVTVNLNHRLGASGLAYGASDSIVGNQQVHDILLALEWIKANIQFFGGDPERITLAGMSSGAILSSTIFISPAYKQGLFNKVVLMSGVPIEPVNVDSPRIDMNRTKFMSQSLGCSKYSRTNDSFGVPEIVCLKTVEAESIANTTENPNFKPVYGDRYIFPDPPTKIINNRLFPSGLDFLIGTEADEDLIVRSIQPKSKKEAIDSLNQAISFFDFTTTLNFTNLIVKYFDDLADDNESLIQERFHGFASDLQFQCPSLLYSIVFASNSSNKVYMYRNDYVSSYFGSSARPYGAIHADDHRMFLGEPFRSPEMYSDDQDRKLSQFMMTVLSDFVKGNDLFWPAISIDGKQSTEINLPRWRIQNNEKFDKIDYDDDKDLCLDWAQYFGLEI